MGDADNPQVMVSVDEVEALMDNAWHDLDEGLESIFSFITILNDHNTYMMSEIASCQKLRRCFMALNVFVIPVVLSIWIAFGTTDIVESNSEAEAALQMIVIALMFISGSIGFPLYVHALLKSYFVDHKIEEEAQTRRVNSEVPGIENRRAGMVSSEQSLPFGDDSLERISECARQANRRFMDNIRQDLERRVSRLGELDRPESAEREEMSETLKDDKTSTAEQQLVDFNSDIFTGVTNDLPGSVRPDSLQKEETDFYGFKVIILNNTQDLSVEIEKQEEEPSLLDDSSGNRDECPLGNIRSITVENVGEGDSYKVCSKENRNSATSDCWQGKVFGL